MLSQVVSSAEVPQLPRKFQNEDQQESRLREIVDQNGGQNPPERHPQEHRNRNEKEEKQTEDDVNQSQGFPSSQREKGGVEHLVGGQPDEIEAIIIVRK